MGSHVKRADMTPERRAEVQRQERKTAYLRETGRPIQVDPAPAIAHVRKLHAGGMTAGQMAAQGELTRNMFNDLIRGHRTADKGGHPIKMIDRPDLAKVLAIRYEPPNSQGAKIDGTGARRRLRALLAAGFGGRFLGQQMGVSNQRIHHLLHGDRPMAATSCFRIAELYEKYELVKPEDLGLTPFAISRARGDARRRDYAPPHCWDVDTIDDPEAIPEWTGACGTELGPSIHKRESIPLCEACKAVGRPASRKFSGEKLRDLRVQHGWSQGALERRLGLGKGHVHHWEDAKYGPSGARLEALLSLLDVTFEEISEEEA